MATINKYYERCDLFIVMSIILIVISSAESYAEHGGKAMGSGSQQNYLSSVAGASLFTTRNNTKVIVQRGGLAVLPCVIKWNPAATVSWIRRQDFQLLTVGLSTYSSDERFLVEHARHMGHWSLRIKSVRDEDRGIYECQLSIHPIQSIFIELRVVEAVADIIGAPDLHIDDGSPLRLECKLKRATENPAYVFWYHNDKMINYDSQDGYSVSTVRSGSSVNLTPSSALNATPNTSSNTPNISAHNRRNHGIASGATSSINHISESSSHRHSPTGAASSTLTSPGSPSNSVKILTDSVLRVEEVNFKHAGNYTCAPSNARPISITVHVLRDEKPAAMQHANRSSSASDVKSTGSSLCSSTVIERTVFALGAIVTSWSHRFALVAVEIRMRR